MKIYLYCTLILSIFCLVSCNSKIKNDLSRQDIIGNVKRITESNYKANESFGKYLNGQLDTKNETIRRIYAKWRILYEKYN